MGRFIGFILNFIIKVNPPFTNFYDRDSNPVLTHALSECVLWNDGNRFCIHGKATLTRNGSDPSGGLFHEQCFIGFVPVAEKNGEGLVDFSVPRLAHWMTGLP